MLPAAVAAQFNLWVSAIWDADSRYKVENKDPPHVLGRSKCWQPYNGCIIKNITLIKHMQANKSLIVNSYQFSTSL